MRNTNAISDEQNECVRVCARFFLIFQGAFSIVFVTLFNLRPFLADQKKKAQSRGGRFNIITTSFPN